MTEENKLEGKKEEGTVETKAGISAEKVETAAVETDKAEGKTEYKHSDYEYKSWSGGVSVPDGWERCLGYADVIRRLKPLPSKPEDTPVKTKTKAASCQKEAKDDTFKPLGPPKGGCCH
ncbi:MAG: hypothetical protein MUO92_00490 [Dehalococcoidales bacterium]|nr:hypothetical protein [Dehalococcoidales bacterium]